MAAIVLHQDQLPRLESCLSFQMNGQMDSWDEMWWDDVKGKALKWLAQPLAHSRHLISVLFSLLWLWHWDLQMCCWDSCSVKTMCLRKVLAMNADGVCVLLFTCWFEWRSRGLVPVTPVLKVTESSAGTARSFRKQPCVLLRLFVKDVVILILFDLSSEWHVSLIPHF